MSELNINSEGTLTFNSILNAFYQGQTENENRKVALDQALRFAATQSTWGVENVVAFAKAFENFLNGKADEKG